MQSLSSACVASLQPPRQDAQGIRFFGSCQIRLARIDAVGASESLSVFDVDAVICAVEHFDALAMAGRRSLRCMKLAIGYDS